MFRAVLRRCALLVTASTALACGSAGTPASGAARPDRTVISTEQLRESQASNLYEVVQRLHPEWLAGRAGQGLGVSNGQQVATSYEVQVFIDTQRAGTSDMLRQLIPSSASSMRYYTASEAQARFGNGNLNGVIQVITTSTKP